MSSAQRPLGSLLRAPLATLVTVGFVITLFVPPAASRPPAPGGCLAQVPRISAGCCSSPPSTLLGLRGGAFNAGADAPWAEACEEGDAHDEAGEFESAIACYTRGLACESIPPNIAVFLYHNRAAVLLKQGSFVKAGDDARAGLALWGGEGSVPEPFQQLMAIGREADRLAAEQEGEASTQGDAQQQAGECSSPSSGLSGLRGGSSNADPESARPPVASEPASVPEVSWEAACEEGDAHDEAGEFESAIASYTRGLACVSIPPRGAAFLYSNRAVALFKQGAFAKAGADARAGLAIFSGGASLGLEQCSALQFMQQLIGIARDADLGEAVEQRRAAGTHGDHDSEGRAREIAAYTRGLPCDATPPGEAATLHFDRAVALLEEGSVDARATVSFHSGVEAVEMSEEAVRAVTRALLQR
ncbi:hypothetical protein T484DRAFT_1982918 [Baffinella frigidus]|nr:hypothetical protein T484DRAFT_1982918 [Cryptophyta sp. CCMP2293]